MKAFCRFRKVCENVFSIETGHIFMKKHKKIKNCNIFVTFSLLLEKTYLQNWFQKVTFWWFSWILITNVHFLLVSWYSGLLLGASLNRLIPKLTKSCIIRPQGFRGGPLPFAIYALTDLTDTVWCEFPNKTYPNSLGWPIDAYGTYEFSTQPIKF